MFEHKILFALFLCYVILYYFVLFFMLCYFQDNVIADHWPQTTLLKSDVKKNMLYSSSMN